MSSWTFKRLPLAADHDETDFAELIQDIFRDAFAVEENERAWSTKGILDKLRHSTLLGLAKSERGETVGYALYSVPSQALLNGRYLLWEDSIGVNQDEQGSGLGSTALLEARRFLPEKDIGWLGGRTQNPAIICRYSKDTDELFPFTSTYNSAEGQSLIAFLLEHIHEIQNLGSRLNLQTGVCYQVYAEGRLGDYTVDLTDSQIAAYERQLHQWGFDRDKGDAVIVVGKIS